MRNTRCISTLEDLRIERATTGDDNALVEALKWFGSALGSRQMLLAFRLILAGMFLISGVGKFVDIQEFSVNAVLEFNILPSILAHAFGWALPFIEVICALCLLSGVYTRFAALGVALLSTSFFIAKATILWNGGDIVCGCFGPIVTALTSVTIWADPPIFMMSLLIAIAPWERRNWLSPAGRVSPKSRESFNMLW